MSILSTGPTQFKKKKKGLNVEQKEGIVRGNLQADTIKTDFHPAGLLPIYSRSSGAPPPPPLSPPLSAAAARSQPPRKNLAAAF